MNTSMISHWLTNSVCLLTSSYSLKSKLEGAGYFILNCIVTNL